VVYDRPLNCRYLTVRERSQEERRLEGRRSELRRFIYAMLIYGTECSAFAVISRIVGPLFHFIFYRDLNARVHRLRGGGSPRSFVILPYLIRNYAMDLQDRPFVHPRDVRDMQMTRRYNNTEIPDNRRRTDLWRVAISSEGSRALPLRTPWGGEWGEGRKEGTQPRGLIQFHGMN